MARTKTPTLNSEDLLEIQSLASYRPRAEAIEHLLAGRFDEYQQWNSTDGFVAAYGHPNAEPSAVPSNCLFEPMTLDRALRERITERAKARHRKDQGVTLDMDESFARARAEVDYFHHSPFEILLSQHSPELVEKALDWYLTPARRNERAWTGAWGGHLVGGWESVLVAPQQWARYIQDRTIPWNGNKPSILIKVLLTGNFELADKLWQARVVNHLALGAYKLEETLRRTSGLFPHELTERLKISEGKLFENLEAALAWGNKLHSNIRALGELFIESEQGDLTLSDRPKAWNLTSQGATANNSFVEAATRLGDVELVRHMFAHGASANELGGGRHVLAQFDDSVLTTSMLQAWLDAGAWVGKLPENIESSSVEAWRMSALGAWIQAGQLGLVQFACENAIEEINIRSPYKGPSVYGDGVDCTLLGLAMEADQREAIEWLIRDKGCRLEDTFGVDGEPCSNAGSEATRSFARAVQDQLEVSMASRTPTKSREGDGRL